MGNFEFSSNVSHSGISAKVVFEIDNLVRRGEKIKAIGVYREVTGVGLAEAKAAVEKYMKDNSINDTINTAPKKKGWF